MNATRWHLWTDGINYVVWKFQSFQIWYVLVVILYCWMLIWCKQNDGERNNVVSSTLWCDDMYYEWDIMQVIRRMPKDGAKWKLFIALGKHQRKNNQCWRYVTMKECQFLELHKWKYRHLFSLVFLFSQRSIDFVIYQRFFLNSTEEILKSFTKLFALKCLQHEGFAD